MDDNETVIGAELLEIMATVMKCIGIAFEADKVANWTEVVDSTIADVMSSIDTISARVREVPDAEEKKKLIARVVAIYDGVNLIVQVGEDAEEVLLLPAD